MSFPQNSPSAAVQLLPRRPSDRSLRSPALIVVALATGIVAACSGGDVTQPHTDGGPAATIVVTTLLPTLDVAREGRYEAWVLDVSGVAYSLGSFSTGGTLTAASPIGAPKSVEVTLEGPSDTDAVPSEQVLLRGDLPGRRATLSYVGAVTQGMLPLRDKPGQFTMFTPSDNAAEGYPSHEEAGVWLFNMAPGETPQKDYYVRVTQLNHGWTYEGWVVRDIGTPGAIWLSYGKFVPDWTGALNQADDTGWGPFSSVTDYRVARLEDFPGDDWISNPLQLPWPSELSLPLNLREKDSAGKLRWTHVISIEPATDRGEAITTERPFFMHPYVDPVGDLPPGAPRAITLRTTDMPSGSAELR